MKTTELDVPQPMEFGAIMTLHGYEGVIPANKIINKRIPGIGATFNEIMSHRHSIIIVPFTAIIEVKKQRHGDSLCVIYGEYDFDDAVNDVLKHLNNDKIPHKKLMTTPESFYKIKEALLKHNPDYINDYFMLIDECDVLVQDALFRKKMLSIMTDFFSFKNKAMISATPLTPSDPRFDAAGFEYIILKPKYKFKKKLNLVATNNINSSTRDVIEFLNKKDDKPILIFTNCKRTIAYLSKLEGIKDDYKIFCNKSLDNDFFKPLEIKNVFDSVASQQYAKYNFFTSRFFSGVDFLIPEETKPHVIMISNVTQTPHSIISPMVTAVQIYGRSRNGVTSTTHITNIHKDRVALDKQTIIDDLNQRIYHISELHKLKTKSYERKVMKVLDDIADKNHANIIFQEDGTVNTYFKDNYILSAITHNLYCSKDTLLKEYEEGDFFETQLHSIYKPFTEEDINKLRSLKGNRKSVEFLKQLDELITNYGLYYIGKDQEEFYTCLSSLFKEDSLLFEAYLSLGADEIKILKYNRKKIRAKLFDSKQGDQKNHMQMVDEILLTFSPKLSNGRNTPVYIDLIEEELNTIYKRFNYQKKAGKLAKANATDIEDYFECKRVNGKKKIDGVYKTYYILNSPKFKLSEEAKRYK